MEGEEYSRKDGGWVHDNQTLVCSLPLFQIRTLPNQTTQFLEEGASSVRLFAENYPCLPEKRWGAPMEGSRSLILPQVLVPQSQSPLHWYLNDTDRLVGDWYCVYYGKFEAILGILYPYVSR